jgi:hypothetical protein
VFKKSVDKNSRNFKPNCWIEIEKWSVNELKKRAWGRGRMGNGDRFIDRN